MNSKYRSSLFFKRLLYMFALPNVSFLLFYFFIPTPFLISLLNNIMFSGAVGVATAFSPGLVSVMASEEPLTPSGYMLHGVAVAWYSIVLGGLWWRFYGLWPATELPEGSMFVTYIKYMVVCAAFSHGFAANAMRDGHPQRQWIVLGAGASACSLLGMILSYWVWSPV